VAQGVGPEFKTQYRKKKKKTTKNKNKLKKANESDLRRGLRVSQKFHEGQTCS
jgi:hypothetical protein